MKPVLSLRLFAFLWVGGAFILSLISSTLWFYSSKTWDAHLTRSFVTGVSLYETLRLGTPPPTGIFALQLDTQQTELALQGDYLRLPNTPQPGYLTNVSILGPSSDPLSGESLTLGIVSDKLRYSVSELVSNENQTAAQKLGQITELLASYCSEPILFARYGEQQVLRLDGTEIWGCDAAPRDLRLLAVLISVVGLAILTTVVLDTSAHFDRFARTLRNRRRLGGPESYEVRGPAELRDIVSALNGYLENERAILSQRAMVLSGVSHDLGTPATRLRLRTALIKEDSLREKLDADIDSMTEMIESVLTYTRAELNEEAPRKLSLTSLVEALVADYQDLDCPVSLQSLEIPRFEGGRSVFASNAASGSLPGTSPILVMARPISLKRAVSNLIENALKYGRRASVELTADPDTATIVIEDEGSGMSASDVEAVIAPFQRGDNTKMIDGFGLGLTIVATVAEQHGGKLSFETGTQGLRACLTISRGP